MNILITGVTGFLGRNFVAYLRSRKEACKIVGTAHSESKLAHFKKEFPDVKVYIVDLASDNFRSVIESIIKLHKINYILHSAAMKHVDICQENPIMALRVNTLASEVLLDVAQRNGVINLIAMSTDKTNNPCNTYGMAKFIMQECVLARGYSIYQGVNFFWSDGSVLDIWFQQYTKNRPITVRDFDHVRYFNTIDQVCEDIFKNLDNRGAIILPDKVFVVKLRDLFEAFCEYFEYRNYKLIDKCDYEKTIEILKDDIENKVALSREDIIRMIDTHYTKNL